MLQHKRFLPITLSFAKETELLSTYPKSPLIE